MVKVLENQIVDLDIVPGKDEQELQAQARTQAKVLKETAEFRSSPPRPFHLPY